MKILSSCEIGSYLMRLFYPVALGYDAPTDGGINVNQSYSRVSNVYRNVLGQTHDVQGISSDNGVREVLYAYNNL